MITKHNGKKKTVSSRFKRKNKFFKTPRTLQSFFVTWPFAKLEMMEILHSYHSIWKYQRPRHIEAPAWVGGVEKISGTTSALGFNCISYASTDNSPIPLPPMLCRWRICAVFEIEKSTFFRR